MRKHNPFPEYYKEHKEELLVEINTMSNAEFCKKYEISGNLYNTYFGGLKKKIYNTGRVFLTDEESIRMRDKYTDFREKTMVLFSERKTSIAQKFGVNESVIQKLVEKGNTLTEIEAGEIVNGKIVVPELVKMYISY